MYSSKRQNLPDDKVIWILEDDAGARFIYEEILDYRYKIHCFETLKLFKQAIQSMENKADLALVDLRLSDGHFLKFIRNDHERELLKIPFMVVSSSDDLDILRNCFRDGAIDYITKPFKKNELIVKIERFFENSLHPREELADVIFDPGSLQVKSREEKFAQLTAKELQIFSLLYRSKGRSVPREEIKLKVWGGTHVSAKAFDVHLFHLRKKISHLGIEIRFQPPDQYCLFVQGEGSLT